MTITHSDEGRAALAEGLAAFVDTGSGTAVVRLFDADDVLLMEFELESTAFSSDGAGVLTLEGTPIAALGLEVGVAVTFEVLNRDGDFAYGGSVSGLAGGGDLEVDNPNIVFNGRIQITQHTYRASE